MSVELFERSAGPRLFKEALTLAEAEMRLVDIGEKLGVAKRQAHIAVMYGKAMTQAGLTDPFIELSAPPANASRGVLDDKFLTNTAAPDPANDASAPDPANDASAPSSSELPPDEPNR